MEGLYHVISSVSLSVPLLLTRALAVCVCVQAGYDTAAAAAPEGGAPPPPPMERQHRLLRGLHMHCTHSEAALRGARDALAALVPAQRAAVLKGCVALGHVQLGSMI